MLRRSLMRYMNLALILVLRSISSAVKQRFPTLEHVVEAGTIQQFPPDLGTVANNNNSTWYQSIFCFRIHDKSGEGAFFGCALQRIQHLLDPLHLVRLQNPRGFQKRKIAQWIRSGNYHEGMTKYDQTIRQKFKFLGKAGNFVINFFMSSHRLRVRHGLLAPKIFCFNSYGKSFAFHWCFSGVLWVPSQVWSFVVLWLGFNPYGLHSSGDLSNLPVFHLYSHWSSKARRKQGVHTSHTFESRIFR